MTKQRAKPMTAKVRQRHKAWNKDRQHGLSYI
nr:MAG TPA: hypothetical protein [Inoviridae sp.]